MKKYQNIFNKKIKDLFKKRQLSYKECEIFFNTLAQLSNSGISLIHIFEIVNINLKDKEALKSIQDNLKKGQSLSSSLEDTKIFNYIAISIVQIGEETGNITSSFEKLSNYYAKLSESKKTVQSSMIYPIILIFSIVFLLIFINYYFIPIVMSMYDYNMDNLNMFTKTMFTFSIFLNLYKLESLIIFLSIILIIYSILEDVYSKKDESGIFMKIPLISSIIKTHTMSNILWTYSIMTSSGIDIVNSSNIIQRQVKNRFVKERLKIFKDSISLGNSISDSLEKLNLKDKSIQYFISLGEQSGNLDTNINILSDMYLKKFDKDIKYITQMIQPILILIISFIVGVLITGVIIPILSYEHMM